MSKKNKEKKEKPVTEETASEAMYDPDYSYTAGNILHNWIHILIFILVFALLSVVTLEFIDKDKR